jgi:PAS domain S-box-containing protein
LGYREESWRLPVGQRVGTAVQAFRPDGRLCEQDEYVAVRALRGESVRNEDQYLHLPEHPDRDFWAVLNASPIWGPDGQLAGAVATMTDTTRLHEVSEQLAQREAALSQTAAMLQTANARLQAQADEMREAAEQLEHRVAQRTSELLAANAQLSESEAALRYQAAVLAHVQDAIIGMDAGMRITTWNRAAEEMYGWRADEVIGRQLPEATRSSLSAEERAGALRALAENGQWRGESIHLRRDGTPFWAEGNVIAVRDPAGAITAYATVNRDTTARRQIEEALRASREQLQALSRRLVEAQERERRYVADQLYNEAAQVLTALRMHLSRSGASAGPGAAAYAAETQYLLDRVMSDLHHLATHLRPAILDRLGLVSAVQQYAAEWGREHEIEVQFEAVGLENMRLNSDTETAVYRVVQEALMNVAKHARASMVGIVVNTGDGTLSLLVEDDGVGFEWGNAMTGTTVGLLGMRERLESVGGRLTVESAPGHGTCVIVHVPYTVI